MGYGYSYETKHTARRFTDRARTVKGITIHHWGRDGSSFDGIVSWFCAPTTSAQTSAHYVAQGTDAAGRDSRRVACIVDPDLIAWHAGDWDANVATIGIECRPEARPGDYAVVAELVARLRATYGNVPLYPHKHWTTTACPGRWDLARLDAMARAVNLTTTPTPSKEDMTMADAAEVLAAVKRLDEREALRYVDYVKRFNTLVTLVKGVDVQLDAAAIAAAIPDDLARSVADELAARLSAGGAP